MARQGTRLYEGADYAGAETKYRHALELNPELREATYNLGGALWRQEKAEEAAGVWIRLAADSLSPTPMAAAANHNLGNAALAGEQLDAAIEAYKQSLRLRPDDMETKFNLAYAQKKKQEQNEGGGGQNGDEQQEGDSQNDQNDQNDQNGQNDPQKSDGQQGGGDGNNDGQNSGDEPPPPSGEGSGEAKMDRQAAEQMLDAMQAAEDDTREKVNAREVRVGARSGKNW